LGLPVGFRFPKASLSVRVRPTVEPLTTEGVWASRVLVAKEKLPGPTGRAPEVRLREPSETRRVWAPAVLSVAVRVPSPAVKETGALSSATVSEDVRVTTLL
jgi:hypothetical protein